jgi:HAD superfamily hydrolase (TIGR01509 family)
MAERFRQGLDTIPGATQLLSRLRLPCAIATNGPREKAELTLGLTGLRPRFEGRLFTAYEVGSFKPDPGLFLHAAQQLQVAPGACGVVEDSLPGLRAGLAAGMTVFSLAPAAQVLDGLGADLAAQVHLIDDLRALDRWLHD